MRPEAVRFPTPEEFLTNVLPVVVERWQRRCLCRNPQFCKLLSFNFEDYQTSPAALLDSEILIDHLIRRHFECAGDAESTDSGSIRAWRCPQCGVTFRVVYEEYGISMRRSFLRPVSSQPVAAIGHFILGFRGFRDFSPERIHDFRPADSVDGFLNDFTGAG